MEYVFIVNPAAGQPGSEKELLRQLQQKKDFAHQLYMTERPYDATEYVRRLCTGNPQKQYCFVAAGGDGTINEVLNGIMGQDNACFSCWPCGSGNDYVKYFGGAERFLDLDRLLKGQHAKVDVMDINGRYSMNVVSFGFDCEVVKTMEKIKRKPLIGGRNAYTTGILRAIFTGRNNRAQIKADGKLLNSDGRYLLCTVANGSYVGGAYKCAPKSLVDDGLLEVCMAKRMPLLRFASMIGKYRDGLHLDDEKCRDRLVYTQAHEVEITSDQEMLVCIDGELVSSKRFVIRNLNKAADFVIPQ